MLNQHIISNKSGIYECFPDIAMTRSGKLICVYRESAHHADLNNSRLILRESGDGGRTWEEAKALTPTSDASFAYNCPRISALPDGSLAILCDIADRRAGETYENRMEQHLWRSYDDGESWQGPEVLPFRGIVPDKYKVLSNGRHIFGIHGKNTATGKLEQYAYYSDDGGKSWTKSVVASDERYNLCEVSILEVRDGTLAAFMRENSGLGYSCKKAISYDFGTTWEGVYDTNIDCCHRPVVDFYDKDKILMTYRYMQGGKAWLGSWTQNLFGAFFDADCALTKNRNEQAVRIFPISFDRSTKSDTGYSGWVRKPDGEFYVVNYLLDDAPLAQIRGYSFVISDVFSDAL